MVSRTNVESIVPGPQVHVPKEVTAGEVVLIKTRLIYPMEPGWNLDTDGKKIPRDIIRSFICQFNGNEVFRAELNAGVAADPYHAFYVKITESGNLRCVWITEGNELFETSSRVDAL